MVRILRSLGISGALMAILGGGTELSLIGCALASVSIGGLWYEEIEKKQFEFENKLN